MEDSRSCFVTHRPLEDGLEPVLRLDAFLRPEQDVDGEHIRGAAEDLLQHQAPQEARGPRDEDSLVHEQLPQRGQGSQLAVQGLPLGLHSPPLVVEPLDPPVKVPRLGYRVQSTEYTEQSTENREQKAV